MLYLSFYALPYESGRAPAVADTKSKHTLTPLINPRFAVARACSVPPADRCIEWVNVLAQGTLDGA